MNLQAKALKCTLVLDPAALAGATVPDGQPRVALRIAVDGRTIQADVAAKSLRRAVAAVAETGPDGIAVILQGRLTAGDVLADAGVSAMPKAPKAATA